MTDLNRILIAEDETDVADMLRLTLQGFDVTLVATGESIVDRVLEADAQLVVLDVHMPRVDGVSALEALKEDPRTAERPVVMLTGRDAPHHTAEYLLRGACNVLQKPFDPMRLLHRLERAYTQNAPMS